MTALAATPDDKPKPEELSAIPPPAEDEELADNIGQGRRGDIVDDEELAWSGTKGGIIDDVLLADNTAKGRKAGIVDDDLLATSGKRGGLAGDDTELA